jgi:hypothetical protein
MGFMSTRYDDLRAKRKKRISVAIWSIGIIFTGILFMVLAKAVSTPTGQSQESGENSPAAAELLAKVAGIPDEVFSAVGQGSANPLPGENLARDGKPFILYYGAEYCPYCAAERWAMVIALSRFGSFSKINTSHSASEDTFPNTQTFSFSGSEYSSDYISFKGLEVQSNKLSGGTYAALDNPTQGEQAIVKKYNAPPYVSKESAGAIPFINFGGKYIITGATFSPGTLSGKSLDEIVAALSDPESSISQGAVGSANAITAAICNLTNQQPSAVCTSPAVKNLQAKL